MNEQLGPSSGSGNYTGEGLIQDDDNFFGDDNDKLTSKDSIAMLSQHSCYSDYVDDLSLLILDVPISHSQLGGSREKIASSSAPSTVSLGKRKACALSDTYASGSSRPAKVRKTLIRESEWSIDTSVPAPVASSDDPDAPIIIAHSAYLQEYFDAQAIPYGVQFEMARLVTLNRLDCDSISIADLKKLEGTNAAAAAETAKTLLKLDQELSQDPAFAKETAAKSPWEELDREEAALLHNPFAGLGNSPELAPWYGGKVQFCGKLQRVDGSYKIVLERSQLGPSCRFTRRFGSKNFFRIKVPSTILHTADNHLIDYFCRPFVLWGCIFRPFYAKDANIFLFKTNEVIDGTGISSTPSPTGMTFLDFIKWHNPPEFNTGQTMTKWAARFALGLSNSVPGPLLDPSNILDEPDIISSENSDMTDGCGFSNKATHIQLYHNLELPSVPTAFQHRLSGTKGMSMLRPDTSSTESPQMWIRPSQLKIKYTNSPPDPAKLTIDVLRSTYMKTPARLSPETIINLAENGVPHAVFVDLLKTSITEVIEDLTTWEGPDAMFHLWYNVERAGGVFSVRRAREASGEARAKGLGDRGLDGELDEDDEDEDGYKLFDIATDQRSSAWWVDQTSGCPSSLEETVMVLLDSGFTPQKCSVLREKLKHVVRAKIKSRTQQFRFEVPCSASAFVVPDPYNVLGPDEIQVKSSRRNLKSPEGLDTDIVLGDVLMTRNPCKVPTDVRKVKAVEHPELRELVDVIVCSTQGTRRLLDFLAGGDYDGDTVVVIWVPEIVGLFQNADLKYSIEPSGLDQCFLSNNEKVDDFLCRMRLESPAAMVRALQQFLLGALRDTSLVGKYSTWHDNAIYTLGYSHPRTIKLAYKFCKVLDGAKTGLTIKPTTRTEDARQYGHPRGPKWKSAGDKKKTGEKVPDGAKYDKTNTLFLKRPLAGGVFIKGPFIMDVILKAAKVERKRRLAEMDTLFSPLNEDPDPHLTKPWLDVVQMAQKGAASEVSSKRRDLAFIAVHVQAMYKEHQAKGKIVAKGTGSSFTSLAIEIRQDWLRALSKKFASSPRPEEFNSLMDASTISRLRASYAYLYDSERNEKTNGNGWSRFPWDVAMRDLCQIKADALGPHKTITTDFYERFKVWRRRL